MKRLVRDVMTTKPYALQAESSPHDAISLEFQHGVRHIPILRGDKLVGIVTDRNLKYDELTSDVTLGQIMTHRPTTVSADSPLVEAVRIMCERRFGCLPVVDGDRLVGILTRTDLLEALLALLESE